MRMDTLDKANKFENEMRKEAERIEPEMERHVAEERMKDMHKSDDTWENVKSNVSSTADTVKEKAENTIEKGESRLDRMAMEKETEVNADLWEKKAQFDLLEDDDEKK